jgi:PhzF family phenazine biosynthesis protein
MKLYQVDAFTDVIFKGNPAGVCILSRSQIGNAELLQNIAAEMNLSETAFLCKQNVEYKLRWFTPETEVSLCGHATLSSAHILWESGLEDKTITIAFNTLSGKLLARLAGNKIELNFPSYEVNPLPPEPKINATLGVKPIFFGTNGKSYLIEIGTLQELRDLKPDFGELKKLGRGFMITCKSGNSEYDFYSRYFAPAVGINEDPVTGSSHSTLAPYWSAKLGKRKLSCYQASRRGGELECELSDTNRVLIRGQAKTVFEIEMRQY